MRHFLFTTIASAMVISKDRHSPYEQPISATWGTLYFCLLLMINKKHRHEQAVKMDYLSQIYSLLQDYVEFLSYEPIYCR